MKSVIITNSDGIETRYTILDKSYESFFKRHIKRNLDFWIKEVMHDIKKSGWAIIPLHSTKDNRTIVIYKSLNVLKNEIQERKKLIRQLKNKGKSTKTHENWLQAHQRILQRLQKF